MINDPITALKTSTINFFTCIKGISGSPKFDKDKYKDLHNKCTFFIKLLNELTPINYQLIGNNIKGVIEKNNLKKLIQQRDQEALLMMLVTPFNKSQSKDSWNIYTMISSVMPIDSVNLEIMKDLLQHPNLNMQMKNSIWSLVDVIMQSSLDIK